MADIGFVYVMGNRAMPGIFKVGMTMHSPSKRALELSSSTSVPMEFEVLAFGEIENPGELERQLHVAFAEYRVSSSREFFKIELEHLVDALKENCNIVAESHHDDGFWRRT